MKNLAYLLSFLGLLGVGFTAHGQYQSLLWKVSGNGLRKPSYLYGTMHISGKLAFQLGDPFYDCIQSADVVALELEPEAWLDALFQDPQVALWLGSQELEEGYYDEYATETDSPLPNIHGYWSIGGGLNASERVREALLYEPDILNYLMFRYGDGDASIDFEEDTWLDMHIYQVAKKMGLETIGLETYEQSDEFIRKASAADAQEMDQREWDEGDINEYEELSRQLEPAYRRQDLDLIDSLTRNASSDAFRTYILLERNKLFVRNIDSLFHAGKSVFAAMGCAHLPGEGGVIETLRELGYDVSPLNKGSRNAKRRKEIDKRIYDRPFVPFTTPDGVVSVSAPSEVYHTRATKESTTWLCLDMANGANYSLTRLKSYNAITGYTSSDLLAIIDSLLYETVAGEVISKKAIKVGRYAGIDVVNKTRRGEYQRQQIVVMPDEIIVLKLAATGDKVKAGFGAEFFDNLTINESESSDNEWTSPDGAIRVTLPSRGISYDQVSNVDVGPDFEVVSTDSKNNAYYTIQRHVIETPGFLDEDKYELQRLMRAFAEDRNLELGAFRFTQHQGLAAIEAEFAGLKEMGETQNERVHAMFVMNALSYLALSTNESDDSIRRKWFDSFQMMNPQSGTGHSYQNDELCFSTLLPYVPLESTSSMDAMLFNADLEVAANSPFGTNASLTLNAPLSAESILVDFQRYHEFSDGEDKNAFLHDKRALVLGIDMKLISERVQWSDSGANFEFVVGDTGTTKRFLHRMVLHNKSFYHMLACYDSIVGLSDFHRTAFETFRSTDTLFPYPHFQSRDAAYFDALVSVDSLQRMRALQITGEMDFTAESAARMRNLLKDLPYFTGEDAVHIQSKLLSGLAADTSAQNIDFLVREFNAFPDSAEYQFELLSALLRMKTARAWRTYAKLVVEEPPIVFDEMGGSGCEALFDSVRLAAPLLPQLMQLLAIDEYEQSIYHLMAMAADSGWLPVTSYRYLVPQLLVEARNELKRLKSSSEEGYGFNTDLLLDYFSLLQPIRREKEVTAFFAKAAASKRGQLLTDMTEFDLEHGILPSDTVVNRLIRMNDQVHQLYAMLREHGATARMPSEWQSREALAKLYLRNQYESNEESADSVLLLSSRSGEIRGTKLDVHFYRVYKASSQQWLGHILAFDARDPSNAWPLFIESDRSVVLDDDEDAMVELENEYLYMEELNREFVSFGSGSTDFGVQWY
jgi:uncharacterized protein YbaP (TraB family)